MPPPSLALLQNAIYDSTRVFCAEYQVDTFFDSYVSGLQNEAQDAVAEQSPFGSGAFGKHQVAAHFSVTQCLGALYAGTMRARRQVTSGLACMFGCHNIAAHV